MKKIFVLLSAIAVLVLLGWFAMRALDSKGHSTTELIDFAVSDTTSIDKIIITDVQGRVMEVVKNESEWTDKDGGCISQPSISFILDAIKNIEWKGYLPENSQEQITKLMASQHIKVEIFQEGEWVKTWYIGPPAQDHYGQIMLVDSPEAGKSDLPVIMKIKGFNGIIEPRFFADPRKWMCTEIFAVRMDRIRKVDVRFYDVPQRSFTVTKNGTKTKVYQQGKLLKNVNPQRVYLYLQNYKKVHYELANFELSEKQIDSMKRTTPFATLKLTETNGKTTKLRMFRINSFESQRNEFGEIVDIDMNKFWCQLPNGAMVKCQYHVFNPLLLGHVFFPMVLPQMAIPEDAPEAN
ncbi:MAG: hypothetical protein LW704_10150 [Cryomorphaceae bacterium]|jgi:hypothetical protein|nr:hypothetical protein [Cryomorphaceae bacterium]